MPHPFDAASRHLTQGYPGDWLDLAGLPRGSAVLVVNADLSTISAAADHLTRVHGPQPYIAHHEIQSGPRPSLDAHMLLYAALVRREFGLMVKSTLFALRPSAVSGLQGGIFDVKDPEHKLEFRYKIIKVWELPPTKLLTGGLGTLPLAPISAVTEEQLPGVVDALGQRLDAEASPSEVPELWTATNILMGVRWPRTLIHKVMKGARQMKDSVIYQEILEEGIEKGVEKGIQKGIQKGIEKGMEKGRIAEVRSMLLRRGKKMLGVPKSAVRSRIEAIESAAVLERAFDRLLDGSFATWNELLDSMR